MEESIPTTNLPAFIVIGAMKAGTTSLQAYLASHPDISMAPKELNFFSEGLRKRQTIDWYKSHFQAPGQIHGEISPSYSKCHIYPSVPKDIHATVPNVKLIYLLREPVARILSHLSHAIGEDSQGRTPEAIFAESIDHMVNTSRYRMQLEYYLPYFSLEQILIVTAERLREDRQNTLSEIFRFIGVDDSYSSDRFLEVRHESSLKVKRNRLGRLFSRYPALRQIESVAKSAIPRRWYPLFSKAIGQPIRKLSLSRSDTDHLRDLLRDDTEGLKRLTGRSFSEWRP